MFKRKINLHSQEDITREIERTDQIIESSGVKSTNKEILKTQILSTLYDLERQISNRNAASISINRVIEGDDYIVSLRFRHKSQGLIEKIKQLLGLN